MGDTRACSHVGVWGGADVCGQLCAPCVCTAVQTHAQSHVHGCANTGVVMQLCSRSGMQAHLHAHGHRHVVVQTRVCTHMVVQAHAHSECVLHVDMSTLVQMVVFTCTKSGQHAYTCTRSCKCTPQTCMRTHAHTHTALPAHAHAVPPPRVTRPPRRQGRKAASCTDNVTDARLPDEGGAGRVVTSHVCQAIVVPSDVVGYRAVVSSQPVSLADRIVGERIEPPFLLDPRPSPWRASGHAQLLQALLAPTGAGIPGTRDAASPCCHHRCHHEPHAGRHHRAPRALPPCQP